MILLKSKLSIYYSIESQRVVDERFGDYLREILCLRRLPYCSYLRAAATVCAVDVGLLPNLLAGPLPPTLFCPPGSRSQSPVCCGAPLTFNWCCKGAAAPKLDKRRGRRRRRRGGLCHFGRRREFYFCC